jgi:trimeric autotransporter adhesin
MSRVRRDGGCRPTSKAAATRRRRSEDGDTLVEVLLALVVLGLASVALIIAFGTSFSASAEHRNLATTNTALASFSQSVSSYLQQQAASDFANNNSANYQSSLQALLPSGYTLQSVTVMYWDPSTGTFDSTFQSGGEQQITYTVTDSAGNSYTNTVIVDDPVTKALPGPSGDASQLVFSIPPSGAAANSVFTTQPVVLVEDSAGNIVTSDLSPISIAITANTGTAGAVLSGCTAVETSGVISFSGCSIDQDGAGYQLTVSGTPAPGKPAVLPAISTPFSVNSLQLSTPVISQVTSSTTSAGAVVVDFTETAPIANNQTYSVQACTDQAMSVGCVTQTNYTSGTDVTGLVQGTSYYVQIIADSSPGFLAATTPPSGPAMATVQLAQPMGLILNWGSVAGAVNVSYSASTNAVLGQTYSVKECSNAGMTQSCTTNANFTSGADYTGLAFTSGQSGPTNYFFTVSANGSAGYLTATSTSASHFATSSLNIPTNFVASPSASSVGVVSATFTASTGTAPLSYTATLCTNSAMTTGCVNQTALPTGTSFSGLNPGTNYYMTITANTPSTAFVSATTAVSGSLTATNQLASPTGLTLGYGSVAGSISVSWTASTNAGPGQTYTVNVCMDSGMSLGCTSNANFTSGSNYGGLAYVVGNPGAAYYVDVLANASPGYIASGVTPVASQADTSQIGTPGTPTLTPSPTTAGVISVTFANSTGTAPTSYTANACTNSAMTQNCVSQPGFTSGAQFTGLTQGTKYFVNVTANPPTGFIGASSGVSASAVATAQLATPSTPVLAYGASAGSINVTSTSSNAPAGQTYTVTVCTDPGMSIGCVSNANFTSGSDFSGLPFTVGTPGATFYVGVVATASTGYLASQPSATASHADTSQIGAPGTPTVTSGTSAGAIVATFAPSTGTTPVSYAATACTNAAMTTGCHTQAVYVSGAQFTGLTAGSSYFVTITANPPAGYVANTSSPSATSALATVQLNRPTITSVVPSGSAGALVVTFSASTNAPVGQTYSATACQDVAMTVNCVTQSPYTSTAQFTALTAGVAYYVTVTALGSPGYFVSPASTVVGPTLATTQLNAPTAVTLGYGTIAGSISVAWTAPTNAAANQTYTVTVCSDAGMSVGCVSKPLTSGSNFGGLAFTVGSAGGSFYADVTANASSGFLASSASTTAGPQADTSDIGAPGTPTVATSATTPGAIVATFTPFAGTVPLSYTATACTNAGMSAGCVTQLLYSSGAQITGLTPGKNYWVTITALPPAGYVGDTSLVSTSSAPAASVQLATPVITSVTASGNRALNVNFSEAGLTATGQTYSASACLVSAPTTCVTQTLTGNGQITGLANKTNYFVTITANGSTGFIVSAPSADSASTQS